MALNKYWRPYQAEVLQIFKTVRKVEANKSLRDSQGWYCPLKRNAIHFVEIAGGWQIEAYRDVKYDPTDFVLYENEGQPVFGVPYDKFLATLSFGYIPRTTSVLDTGDRGTAFLIARSLFKNPNIQKKYPRLAQRIENAGKRPLSSEIDTIYAEILDDKDFLTYFQTYAVPYKGKVSMVDTAFKSIKDRSKYPRYQLSFDTKYKVYEFKITTDKGDFPRTESLLMFQEGTSIDRTVLINRVSEFAEKMANRHPARMFECDFGVTKIKI